MNTVPLHTLAPGRRFALWSYEKDDYLKTGVVVEHFTGSSEVRYSGYQQKSFTPLGGEEVVFSSPLGTTNISLNTQVIPL